MNSYIEAYRAILQTDYCSYCEYVNDGFKVSKFHKFLCDTVQNFVERPSNGKAFEVLVISTPPQHGKLLDDDTLVLTSKGWKRHGDLAVGDYVIGIDGKFKRVTAVHPKYHTEYRVTFTNGESILCHGAHEWVVYDRAAKKIRTLETRYMAERVIETGVPGKRGHRYMFQIPQKEIVSGRRKKLHVHPYVMGAWLGDGTNRKPWVCSCKDDIATLEEIGKHYKLKKEYIHHDTGVITWNYDGLNYDLHKYGMCYYNKTVEKRIPEEYLTASIEQRLELLAGLLDTDGYCDVKHNRYVFTTSEKKLKDSFISLISTFGWHVSEYEVEPRLSTSGIHGKRVYWQLAFNPTIEIPCRLDRKRLKHFSKQRKESICKIEKAPHTQGNCITVEGGVYLVGKHLIPTHNSLTITETFPSWYLGRHQKDRVIEISYSDDFAERFGRRNKQKIEDFGDKIFGIGLADSPNTAKNFELSNHLGGMMSAGAVSGVTGNKCNLMIIDDPVKTQVEAESETYRNRMWHEWLYSWTSRMAAGGKIIIIMTRWHEDDLAGRVIEQGHNVEVVNIPLEAEDEDDILGRNIGDALCPEIGKDNEWLADFKQSMLGKEGSKAWNALYQGHPVALQGNLIKREWWRYYEELPPIQEWMMSVDAAFKDGDDNDFVAIQVWGKTGANMYLVDAVKKHLDMPSTVREIERLRGMYSSCKTTLIEDKANGSAIIQILRKTMTGIIPVNPQGGKVARVNAISGAIESGNVYLPLNKPFTEDFVNEFSSFPNGKHDDQVDACSQCLNRFIYYRAETPKARRENPLERAFPMLKKNRKHSATGKGDTIHVI